MYERTLQSAVRYLATVPKHTVSIRELWEAAVREARAVHEDPCALPDFATLLDADARFRILDDGILSDEDGAEDSPDSAALSDLGFSASCLVTLRRGAEPDDGDEMPSIVHRHLSETKPVRIVSDKGISTPAERRSRPKKRTGTPARSKKQGARRRRT